MQNLWNQAEAFLWNLFNRPKWTDIIDVLIVAFIIYQLFMITHETRASQVLKGLAVLLLASFISDLAGLTALNWIISNVLNNGAVVLVILFQPELRRALEQIGRGTRLERGREDAGQSKHIIDEITQCLLRLSRRRVGALIVFEQKTGLKDFLETGTSVDAVISSALLENIFEPNTPLHDGAVIIRGTRVTAAACVLTLSESNSISHDLGTRHRAAIGVTETTDAVVMIVSEETGIISMARGGRLTRHLDAGTIGQILGKMYHEQDISLMSAVRNLFKRRDRRVKP